MGNWIQEIFDGDVYDAGKGHDFNQVIALSNRLSQTEISDINFTLADTNQNHDKTYRWTNNIQFVAGDYQFNYTTDDGMRFYINNVLVPPTSPNTDSWHTQGPTNYVAPYTIPSDGMYNVRVEYFNHKGGGTAHFWWVLVNPKVQPTPPPQTIPVPITTYIPPAQPPADLVNVVAFSKLSTDRQYVKGTMVAVQDDFIIATNTSNALTVAVAFDSIGGVTFDPPHFNLAPLQQASITIHFDPKGFEQLGEGLNQINCVVKIAAVSIATQPSGPNIIPPTLPPSTASQPTVAVPVQPGGFTETFTAANIPGFVPTPTVVPATAPATGSAAPPPVTTAPTSVTNPVLAAKLARFQLMV